MTFNWRRALGIGGMTCALLALTTGAGNVVGDGIEPGNWLLASTLLYLATLAVRVALPWAHGLPPAVVDSRSRGTTLGFVLLGEAQLLLFFIGSVGYATMSQVARVGAFSVSWWVHVIIFSVTVGVIWGLAYQGRSSE